MNFSVWNPRFSPKERYGGENGDLFFEMTVGEGRKGTGYVKKMDFFLKKILTGRGSCDIMTE